MKYTVFYETMPPLDQIQRSGMAIPTLDRTEQFDAPQPAVDAARAYVQAPARRATVNRSGKRGPRTIFTAWSTHAGACGEERKGEA